MNFELRLPAMILICFVFFLNKISCTEAAVDPKEQEKAEEFLDYYNSSIVRWKYKRFTARWNEETNITAYNQAVNINTSLAFASFEERIRANASRFNISQLKEDTARQLKLILFSTQLKNATERARKETLVSEMKTIYSTAKVNEVAVNVWLVTTQNSSESVYSFVCLQILLASTEGSLLLWEIALKCTGFHK